MAVTWGIAAIALALYLSLWIYTKRRSTLPLIGFAAAAVLDTLCVVLSHWQPLERTVGGLALLSTFVWIAASFVLRREVVRHFHDREGWEFRIGPWFTLFFSAVYINYCLNPVFVDNQRQRDTLISLNLSAPSDLRK